MMLHKFPFDDMGGKQSLPRITPQDKAVLDLKLQRDNLKQYQKKIQCILDREHDIAKVQLAAGQRERALIALRKRKYQLSLLTKTEEQLITLEKLVSTIEFSLVELSVIHGLKRGTEVLKELNNEMDIDSVEKLLGETAEAREYQREVGEMLANNLTLDDEEAVLAELHTMQRDITKESQPPLELPDAPNTQPRMVESDIIADKVAVPA